MTVARHFESAAEVESLALVGSRLTSVVIAEHVVDLVLGFDDARNALVRVESAAYVVEPGTGRGMLEAGPELGRAVISLLGREVVAQAADGLDLILHFAGDTTLRVCVDESGYESYEVTLDGVTHVASRAGC